MWIFFSFNSKFNKSASPVSSTNTYTQTQPPLSIPIAVSLVQNTSPPFCTTVTVPPDGLPASLLPRVHSLHSSPSGIFKNVN